MGQLLYRLQDLLGVSQDAATRNLYSVLACIAVYFVFLNRNFGRSTHRARRVGRCPDSILRGN